MGRAATGSRASGAERAQVEHDRAPASLRFAVLCWPRSGSYLMVDLLNQLPSVLCHGEVFKPARVELAAGLSDDPSFGKPQRDADPARFVERVFAATPDRTTGFKLFWTHDRRAVEHVLGDASTRLLFLFRNPVDMYVSLLNARATGLWIARRPGAHVQAERLRFDVEEFDRQSTWAIRSMRRAVRIRDAAPGRALLVGYEELDDAGLRDVARWLGTAAPDQRLQSKLVRQVTAPHDALIENHAEMVAHVDRRFPGLRTATAQEWVAWASAPRPVTDDVPDGAP